MKHVIYTRPDGGVSVVIPTKKERLEKVLGPLTDEEFEAHVMGKSIPTDASKIRQIELSDIPASREFRNAWKDVTPESRIDICCETARDIQLEKVRKEREGRWAALDAEYIIALEQGSDTASIISRKEALRNITEPLKALKVKNKYNDENLLNQIRSVSVDNA